MPHHHRRRTGCYRAESLENRLMLANWINPAGGPFNTPGNWSTNEVPDADEDANITLAGTYTVSLPAGSTASVRSLNLGGASGVQTLSLRDAVLTLNAASTVNANGDLLVGRSVVNGPGALTNAGTVRGRGLIPTINAPFGTTATSRVIVEGGGVPFGQSQLRFANGFTSRGVIELTSVNAGMLPFDAVIEVLAGNLTNAAGGTVRSLTGVQGGGVRGILASFVNQGTFTAEQLTTVRKTGSSHANSGTIDTSPGGDIVFDQGGMPASTFTSTGTLIIPVGRKFTVNSAAAGALADDPVASVVNFNAGTVYSGGGTLQFDSQTVNLNVPLTNQNVDLLIDGCFINGPGTITNVAGKTLRLARESFARTPVSTSTIVNTAVDNFGRLESRGLFDRIRGAYTSRPGSSIFAIATVEDVFFTIDNGFVNNGSIDLMIDPTATVPYFTIFQCLEGVLVNMPGQTITMRQSTNIQVSDDGRNLYATLDNRGTINIFEETLLRNPDPARGNHVNTGVINVMAPLTPQDSHFFTIEQTGALAGFTNNGVINIATGRRVFVIGTPLQNSVGGRIIGTGSATAQENPAGTIAPGDPPAVAGGASFGILTFTTYNQGAAGSFEVEIGGATAGTQHDQLIVSNGPVVLNGALRVSTGNNFTPAVGQTFMILDRRQNGPVAGTFAGLPQGAIVSGTGANFQISYTGGDGNDIVLTAVAGAAVAGRHVFYNNSGFDGANAAANAADDGAIAADKAALLPGQTATNANYTNYSRGINGIMVDIANLPAGGLTAGNFTLRVGDDNTPADWLPVTPPPPVAVRDGAGVSGSDRVTITFPDGSIRARWLQVIVRATTETGLPAPHVFYFGNVPGDTFDGAPGAAAFLVNAADVQRTRLQQFQPAPVTSLFDHDHSGNIINAADVQISRINQFMSINRITVPTSTAAAGGLVAEVTRPTTTFAAPADARLPSRAADDVLGAPDDE